MRTPVFGCGGFSPGAASLLCSGPPPSLRLRGPGSVSAGPPRSGCMGYTVMVLPGSTQPTWGRRDPGPDGRVPRAATLLLSAPRPLSAAPRPASSEVPGGMHALDKRGSPGLGPSAGGR